MAKTRGYKRFENNVFRSVGRFMKKSALSARNGIFAFFQGGRRKLTIMIVPHSQKKVINFQASIFSLVFFCVFITGIVISFFWFSQRALLTEHSLTSLERQTQEAQANLDNLKDETGSLLNAAQKFQNAFTGTLSVIGLDSSDGVSRAGLQGGDLSSLFGVRETVEGSLREVDELQRLTGFLENSVQPMQEIGKLLESQGTVFSDIPSLWPIKGGIGHISMSFGQNKHPFTRQWYIHRGVDLSTFRAGDPIIATASGQVVAVEFSPGFGNFIIIQHKHGFFTRYAHLRSFRVQRGQRVQQGDIIGYIGNTGASTGPHVHYEVHIGSDVVDPIQFLNIGRNR